MFNVYMPFIYSEGKANAVGRLQEAIDKKEKGTIYSSYLIRNKLRKGY
jgi:hypothetical protein